MLKLVLEKRGDWSLTSSVAAISGAIILSAIVTSGLLSVAGASLTPAVIAIFDGAFGTPTATINTLLRATPLILTGVAVTIAFRAKVWNIGADGQLYAGAIAGYAVYWTFGYLPPIALITLVVASGFIGGAALGLLAGWLRVRYAVNEVLATVMLNYVVRFGLSYLLVTQWRDPTSFFQQTPRLDIAATLPTLMATKLHLGFAFALAASVIVYVILSRTALGYEIKAAGQNPIASHFKGINVDRTTITVMVISGGIAGLAGVGEVFGNYLRLRPDISVGYGFTGIVIALLAGLRPLVVVPVAILFAALSTGSVNMQIVTSIPSALTQVIQAVVLLFFLIAMAPMGVRVKKG